MKTLLVLVFSMIVSVTYSQNLNDGLIVYYPFDGNALDSSENHFDGITNAEFTADRFGNPNRAIHFNGIDHYLAFPPNEPELKPFLPVSFAFWVKFDTTAPNKGTVLTTDYDQNNHSGISIVRRSDNTLGIGYGDATDDPTITGRKTKAGTTALESEQWYYIIGIVQGPEDMDIYVDCVNDGGSYEGFGGDLGYTDCEGNLGRIDQDLHYPPNYFNGSIDDFRYWNRALTQENIDSLCVFLRIQEEIRVLLNELEIYPNPAVDVIYLEELPNQVSRIDIINKSGKVMKSFYPSNRINIEELKAGTYLLRLVKADNTFIGSKKFVKK